MSMRRLEVTLSKQPPLLGQSFQRRRSRPAISIDREVVGPLGVDDEEQDVWTTGRSGGRLATRTALGQSCPGGDNQRRERYSAQQPVARFVGRWQPTTRDASGRLGSEQHRIPAPARQASPLIEDQALQRCCQIGPGRNQQEDENEIPANSRQEFRETRDKKTNQSERRSSKPTETPRELGRRPVLPVKARRGIRVQSMASSASIAP